MSVKRIAVLFWCVSLASFNVSMAQQGQVAPANRFAEFLERSIKTNDKDGDGKVSKDEAPERLKQNFDRLDANKDGFLDAADVKLLAQRRPQQPNARPRAARPSTKVPDNVEFQADIAYREGNAAWRLDLAMPKERGDAARPGLVIIHGGGWRSGDKAEGQWRSTPLAYAAKGYVCISINYRLTDDAPFPACVEDCKCAVRWLCANAKKYNVDPERIGAYGNSAGAHLVAMLGLAGPDAKLEGDGPHQDQSSLVQAVCCSATPADFLNWKQNGNSASAAKRGLFAGPEESLDERRRKASPVTHANPKTPPFLIVHGTADTTVPVAQGDALAAALKEAGAKDVTYKKYDGAGHGVFRQHADETEPLMEAFFARVLQGN